MPRILRSKGNTGCKSVQLPRQMNAVSLCRASLASAYFGRRCSAKPAKTALRNSFFVIGIWLAPADRIIGGEIAQRADGAHRLSRTSRISSSAAGYLTPGLRGGAILRIRSSSASNSARLGFCGSLCSVRHVDIGQEVGFGRGRPGAGGLDGAVDQGGDLGLDCVERTRVEQGGFADAAAEML